LGLHDGFGDDVLGGDQLDLVALAAKLCGDGAKELRVTLGKLLGEKSVVRRRSWQLRQVIMNCAQQAGASQDLSFVPEGAINWRKEPLNHAQD